MQRCITVEGWRAAIEEAAIQTRRDQFATDEEVAGLALSKSEFASVASLH